MKKKVKKKNEFIYIRSVIHRYQCVKIFMRATTQTLQHHTDATAQGFTVRAESNTLPMKIDA